jgi:hypothetical protein
MSFGPTFLVVFLCVSMVMWGLGDGDGSRARRRCILRAAEPWCCRGISLYVNINNSKIEKHRKKKHTAVAIVPVILVPVILAPSPLSSSLHSWWWLFKFVVKE